MKNKVLLVDGMALLFRGFYATSYRGNFMETSKGIPTNGVYQFLRYLFDAIHKFTPDQIICCWDMGSKTFRSEIYEGYKANRSAPPEELVPQFELVRQVTEVLNMPNVGLENYEADDCIGTLARRNAKDNEIIILTGDHDLLQLVDDNIKVAIMKKGQGNYEVFDHQNFHEKKGIHPNQIVDLKGLMGDSADNYPGVRGIGEKTALKLLKEHETIDNLLENIDKLPKGVQTKINENLDMLLLSRNLAEINCNTPISYVLGNNEWLLDYEDLENKFTELNLNHMTRLIRDISN